MSVKGIEDEKVNFLNIGQTEDGEGMRRSLNCMSEKKFLKDLEALILSGAITDKLAHHVVHDLHEAGHLLL